MEEISHRRYTRAELSSAATSLQQSAIQPEQEVCVCVCVCVCGDGGNRG